MEEKRPFNQERNKMGFEINPDGGDDLICKG